MKKYLTQLCAVAILLCTAITLWTCKKDKEEDPMIQTLSAKPYSPTSVLFTGNILNKGTHQVLDYGFVYGIYPTVDETSGTKVSLGSDAPSGNFTKQVDNINILSVSYQSTLYVRAYIKNDKGTAYGTATSFALPTITATSVSPQSGKSGDQITINGQFFSTPASQINVTFNSVAGKVISAADNKIVVQIPSGISASHGSAITIQIGIGSQKIYAPGTFTILANIKDFSPKNGPIGTTVSFTGDNLPSYYYSPAIRILFGGVDGGVLYSSSLQATVPATVTSDKLQVSVIVNGVTTTLPGEFALQSPTITSISPTSGVAGTQLTVTGTNFPLNGSATYTLGSTTIYPASMSSTLMYFTVPTSMPAGDYAFTLKAGPSSVTASQKFTVVPHAVTGFSPSSGSIGTEVNISGTFLSGQYYTVYFGSVSAGGQATSGSNVRTNVPFGANAGDVKISVQNNGQSIQAPGNFTITSPSIDSFTPTTGVAGTIVTINGNGFGTNIYNVSVKFGTIAATVVSVTDKVIKATVPSNNLGAMKITVVVSGQTVVSTDNFTATN